MIARFFIDRPILAWVISIVIVLMGAITAGLLPIAQYPEITPPTVRVTTSYPGANAQVVADTVAAPIEQQVNGVENMLYMSSQSSNDGSYTLDVTFKLGTDVNMAQVLVQNRVAIAQPVLPDIVSQIGVTVKKRSPDILLAINLYSDDSPTDGKPVYDQLYMSNYATNYLLDAVARLEGVGDVLILGQRDYSMRIWIDPDKLASRNLTAVDVVTAVKEQNIQVAAGAVGQPPIEKGLAFQYTLSALGRLTEAQQFANIIVKTGSDGKVTYVKDIGRAELRARSETVSTTRDGKPSAGMAIFQLPGSNALDVAERIKAKMRELSQNFPKGLHYAINYDTTPFITESVDEVINTLRDAVILVAIVVLLFLQDWKSLLLPLIDVTVSLVGTFAIMKLMGFSLNNLTLFGLVLAIGIVVDDAIVVLENIERWLDQGLPVREATIKAMSEITGPIIAITLVLSSVLLPSAFLSGITGQFFRQFALTISASMLISAINAMTMTPARAASVFAGRKPGHHGDQGKEALPWWLFALVGGVISVLALRSLVLPHLGLPPPTSDLDAAPVSLKQKLQTFGVYAVLFIPGAVIGGIVGKLIIQPVNLALSKVFVAFNHFFDRITRTYGSIVSSSIRLSVVVLIIYAGLLALTGWTFTRIPLGFIPAQDQGVLVVDYQLPDSASLERTEAVNARIEEIVLAQKDAVAHTLGIPGTSFVLNANSSNYGSMFIVLKPFPERRDPKLGAEAMAQFFRRKFQEDIPEARVSVFGRPSVPGLGSAGGFKLMVEATGDVNYNNLAGQAAALAAKARQMPGIVGVFSSFRAGTPQLFVDIDRVKVKTENIPLSDVFTTLQINMGGYYVNDFNRFGRTWQVNIEADAKFRMNAETMKNFKVRNAAGNMVPLGTLMKVENIVGPVTINRYNMFPSSAILGSSLPDVSTGDVMTMMEMQAENSLPSRMKFEWTELSYLQKQASEINEFRDLQQNPFSAFVLGSVLVFFVLCGLYESWSLPMSVILVVPMCLLSSLAGIAMAHMDINIFVQVGFVVLAGLACKNAILIVEFARDRQAEGIPLHQAAAEAATTRLRPIVMTSVAFIFGMIPLVIAHGAGAEMRRTLGTAVVGGMLGVTLFGIFLTPVFFYIIRNLVGRKGA
jgi:multidrug efflux pump